MVQLKRYILAKDNWHSCIIYSISSKPI